MRATPTSSALVVLHGAKGESLPPDELDVLDEVEAVSPVLRDLGYATVPLAVSLDFGSFETQIADLRPVGVFNLVEAINGQSRFAHLATALLDSLRIPYTGCPTAAIWETTDKRLAKKRLIAAGIPTPAWVAINDLGAGCGFRPGQWILKPVCEDASIGIDPAAVVQAGEIGELRQCLWHRRKVVRLDLFAESFVAGREISVSLIEGPDGALALPPAEILFKDFPADRPHIVDYLAKWAPDSFEYIHTPRSMEFPADDAPMLESVRALAKRCWDLFGLRGYARVDFRVDGDGRPWVIDVNTNPSLGQDSGFLAAVRQYGKGARWAVEGIVRAALPYKTSPCS